jgi:hypothetical protein
MLTSSGSPKNSAAAVAIVANQVQLNFDYGARYLGRCSGSALKGAQGKKGALAGSAKRGADRHSAAPEYTVGRYLGTVLLSPLCSIQSSTRLNLINSFESLFVFSI